MSRSQDARFTDAPPVMNREPGQTYLRRNLDLCRAVNLTSLAVVLNKMVEEDGLPKEQRDCFYNSAEALLQLMRTENNRWFAKATGGQT